MNPRAVVPTGRALVPTRSPVADGRVIRRQPTRQPLANPLALLPVQQPASLKGLSGQRVIAALDLKGDRIVTRGWQAPSACASTDVFEALLTLGFHRALVTDVSRDGTLEGPGVEAAAWVAREGFLVQASGGVKELGDLLPLAKVPGVVGAISGKALMEGFIPLDDPRLRAALEGGA